jgi:hypothetical protein
MSDEQKPEQTKEEAFAENPDRFEDLTNVLLCVKKENGKFMVMVNNMSDQDACVVRCLAEDKIREFQAMMAMQRAKDNNSGIITPGDSGKNGFRSFLKNGRR